MPAVRTRVLTAVAAAVRALDLEDIEAVYVRARKTPPSAQTLPCVEVRRDPAADADRPLTLEHDEVGYGILVLFKFRDDLGGDGDPEAARADAWYERIAHEFRNDSSRLRVDLPECRQVTIEPLPEIDPQDDGFQNVQGGMVVRVSVAEPRGPLPTA